LLLAVFLATIFPTDLPATELVLKDGRIIKGRIGKVVSLVEDARRPRREGDVPLILLVDDQLHRIFIPMNAVQEVRDDDAGQIEEKFHLRQPVKHAGPTIKVLGPALRVTPFDDHGRRIFTMYAQRGPEDVIQVITELTPRYFKAEGNTHVWDMRAATTTLPSDTVDRILANQTNPNNPEHIKKIARFYLQAERFEQAQKTLEKLLKDFPDQPELKDQVTATIRSIRQLWAQQVLTELKLRRAAGQHRRVYQMLQKFPSEGVAGEILQGVRELLQDYDAKIARRTKIIERIGRLIPQIKSTPQRMLLEKIRGEIAAELSVDTLERFAAFVQNYDDAQMTAEEKLALAVSGWLMGKDAATVKLSVALSAYNVREKTRRYLSEPIKLNREQIFGEFAAEEAAAPSYVVKILANMKPPQDPPPPASADKPGYFRLETPGLPDGPPVVYWVQLPPEYDPYRAYPTIIALHGPNASPEEQVTWWAGDWSPPPAGQEEKKDIPLSGRHEVIGERAGVMDAEKPADKDPPPAIGKDAGPPPIPASRTDREKEKAPADNRPVVTRQRTGQAARQGYIVIAPQWMEEHQRQYNFSAREHAAAICALRDACRRFAVDTDRVYLTGQSIGGDAAWDIGLAHPDLWAGVIPVSAQVDKFCNFYTQNARYVPFYFVLGELDGEKMFRNAPQLEYYLRNNFPTTVVEFQGRGHEDFYDEILRMFQWMGQYHRNFYPRQFTCSTLRDTDSFFWWVEFAGMPPRTRVDPKYWPPPSGTLPFQVSGTITPGNSLNVTARARRVTVWISPKMLDFKQRTSINVNGRMINVKQAYIQGDLKTLLEDVSTRGDRQHPFWAKYE
jgi:pimeloyl-ACP methyl ester carboxylesterase